MFDKIKQLKELRDQAQQIRAVLAQESVSGEGGHGKVTIVMNGNQEVLAVEVEPTLLNEGSKEDLQKHIAEAANDAIKKAQRVMAQKMQGMSGLGIPGT
ncbi:MAG: YbaB/EbfC family nucleoid-associated protein [Patescibacteria group bacterium]